SRSAAAPGRPEPGPGSGRRGGGWKAALGTSSSPDCPSLLEPPHEQAAGDRVDVEEPRPGKVGPEPGGDLLAEFEGAVVLLERGAAVPADQERDARGVELAGIGRIHGQGIPGVEIVGGEA